MKWLTSFFGALLILGAAGSNARAANGSKADWLIDPSPFKAQVREDQYRGELVLENGLVRRSIRLAPNAATVDYRSLVTGEQLLRATGPEARVTLNGTEYAVGGLEGQPCLNFLKDEWLGSLRSVVGSYALARWAEAPMEARFSWKKRPEWLSRDLPWPAPGKHIVMRYQPPAAPRKLAGAVLYEEKFGAVLEKGWTITASMAHERTSFSNEGKAGEIMALPNTAVYAQRDWPKDAVSVEVNLDAGDDTQSNAWGPGLALVGGDGAMAHFIIRPNQQVFETTGGMTGQFDRAKSVRLRIRLEGGKAICEAAQGEEYKAIATVAFSGTPAKLRVGKLGAGGKGKDHDANGTLVRCHINEVIIRGPEPKEKAAPRADLPEIDVHYTIYDGIPLIEKWVVVRNTTASPVRVNALVSETLHLMETEAIADPNINIELSSLYVESDYAYLAMNAKSANKQAVRWKQDKAYHTQTSYFFEAPVLLEVGPEFGPDVDVAPKAELVSVRAFELFRDSSERERRGLAQRRMYKVVAPWSHENPVMSHLISSRPDAIRAMIDQAAEVGFEMIILSFGSGLNMESTDAKYQAVYRELADYAKSKGIVIGSYSLLASRGAATGADNCRGPGNRIRYGVMPCLGAKWGQGYLKQMKDFMIATGFGIFENDGSYPGDTCAAADHPGHRGLSDSQWVQYRAMCELYQWCRANAVYVNVPDWYIMNGSSKTAMGYKENNWSLPRATQEIIERQNVYDGTWEKTGSMGWMMVPLTQYHGGGAAATIEPLKEHLPHYEARLANLFGAGVQACYRGPRLFDSDETKALVKKWVSFYKAHREVLDADIVHLRRPDGRDWDGIVHVNPRGKEKALAFIYNPLAEEIERTIRIPLYYSGLTDKAMMRIGDQAPRPVALGRDHSVSVTLKIGAQSRQWVVFTAD